MAAVISIYHGNIKQIQGGKDIPVDLFLQYIQEGKWQDDVLAVRTGNMSKTDLPYCTMSGKFNERKISGLLQHSGLLCIDIDDVDDPEDMKSIVCPDKYVHAAFVSVSGKGLALLFKINPEKHNEAFEGLQEYLYTTYQIIVDPSCRDVSRARIVSYDPHIYINEKSEKFAIYPKKQAALKKIPEVVFVKSDFDSIVQEIVNRRVDLTSDYHAWLRIAFAISDRMGEAGRSYFHQVSQFHPDYKPDLCDRQYTNCMKARRSGITIATFYYYAKQAGIRVMSEQTKLIVQSAALAKKGARTKESVVEYLQDAEGISPTISQDIIDQVFDNNIHVDLKDNEVDAVELWLKQNYELRRNVITRYIESNGKPLQTKDFNTIYISGKKVFEKCSYELIDRIINSDFTPDFNPLIEFFDRNQHRQPRGVIKQLFDTVESDTGMSGSEFFPDYKLHFGTKWLVGLISAAHMKHSPLMLVLSGNIQGTGKTEWWRRLLPAELRTYYGESKLDAGKDDEILMTQKWIIMDDEMGGKSKNESKRLKELTSKQTFSLREPYGRNNVDLQRLAALGGTTNDNEVINDPTGNRRIIPINVLSINHQAYNAVDKVDVLMEAYHLYTSGFQWELTRDDIKILNENTSGFEQYSIEYELINKHYDLPSNGDRFNITVRTATDIKVRLEQMSQQRLSLDRIGKELKRMGYISKSVKMRGQPRKAYEVVEIGMAPVLGSNP
jgi:predicted P-loop ATPase